MKTSFSCFFLIVISIFSYTFCYGKEIEAEEAQSSTIVSDSLYDSEDFKKTAARIKKEQRFSNLRKERRDILQLIPKLKAEIDSLNAEYAGLLTEKAEIKSSLAGIPESIEKYRSRMEEYKRYTESRKRLLEELEKKSPTDQAEADEIKKRIEEVKGQLSELEYERARSQTYIKKEEDLKVKRETRLNEINSRISVLKKDLEKASLENAKILERQFLVEDAINVLLIPETAQNQFKLYITAAFSVLVGLVIVGFFIVAWNDAQVRRSIFSSQSGIQFLTLFSLVIAIILFGITNILEGKELAALLGGLSGYILGRVGLEKEVAGQPQIRHPEQRNENIVE